MTLVEHLQSALAHLDGALVKASDELVRMGFSERSARSVVQHLQRAHQDVEDVVLLITLFSETKTPRLNRGE